MSDPDNTVERLLSALPFKSVELSVQMVNTYEKYDPRLYVEAKWSPQSRKIHEVMVSCLLCYNERELSECLFLGSSTETVERNRHGFGDFVRCLSFLLPWS